MEIKIFKERTELLSDGRFWYSNAFKTKLDKYKFLTKNDIAEKISIKNGVDIDFIKSEFKSEIQDAYNLNNDRVLYKKIVKELDFNISPNNELFSQELRPYYYKENYSINDSIKQKENTPLSFNHNQFFYDYKNKNIYYYPSAEKLIDYNKKTIQDWYNNQKDRYDSEGWDKPKWITDYENNNFYVDEFNAEEETMLRNKQVTVSVYDEEFNLEIWTLYFSKPSNLTKLIKFHETIEKNNQPYYDTFEWMQYPDDKELWAEMYSKNEKIWNSFWDFKKKKYIPTSKQDAFPLYLEEAGLDFSYKL